MEEEWEAISRQAAIDRDDPRLGLYSVKKEPPKPASPVTAAIVVLVLLSVLLPMWLYLVKILWELALS